MAIIYSYPSNNNIQATDIIVGTSTVLVGGKPKNQTKSFSVESLGTFISTNFPTPTPDINDVLLAGNTTLLDLNLNTVFLYDDPEGRYAAIRIVDSSFNTYSGYTRLNTTQTKNGIAFLPNIHTAQIYIPDTITAGRIYTFPDLSGTVALTSDLPIFSGSTNQIPKLNGYALEASSIYDDGVSIGIGTIVPDPCAKLQIDSTTQGFLPPRMNTADINAIVDPADGLIVYNSETYQFYGFTGGVWKTFRMDTI